MLKKIWEQNLNSLKCLCRFSPNWHAHFSKNIVKDFLCQDLKPKCVLLLLFLCMVGNYVTKVCTLYKLGLEVFIDDEDEILEKTTSGNYYTLVFWHHGDGIYQDSHFSGACAARCFSLGCGNPSQVVYHSDILYPVRTFLKSRLYQDIFRTVMFLFGWQ